MFSDVGRKLHFERTLPEHPDSYASPLPAFGIVDLSPPLETWIETENRVSSPISHPDVIPRHHRTVTLTGRSNCVIWNGVHHKTCTTGGELSPQQ